MIGFTDISLGEGGIACTRCAGAAAESAYRAAEDVVAEIGALSDAAAVNVRLTGPEPFGHPELPRLVSAVAARASRIALDTQAAAFESEGNARGALDAGVRHIRVTLLGGTPGLHDALSGAPGRFERALAGMKAFRAVADAVHAPVSVTARIPVCAHNVRDLPAAMAAAVDAGADEVTITVTDDGRELPGSLPWLTSALDTGVVNGVWAATEGVPLCLLREHVLHAAEIVSDSAGLRPAAHADACSGCTLASYCAAPVDAAPKLLAALRPPADAARIADGIARIRARQRM